MSDKTYFSLAPGKNIENMVGITKVPLGVAGPVQLKSGQKIKLPLATTEGALVASVNRGCKAITQAGGATVKVVNQGATRGPVFRVANLKEGEKLIDWVEKNLSRLKALAAKTEPHLTLLDVKPQLLGREVFFRFRFDTSEAMGMNMVTMATEAIAGEIEKNCQAQLIAVSGNYCVDKKVSWLNFIEGRGKQVWAEIILPQKIVNQVLKSSPEEIVAVVKSKQWLGSILSGSLGFNGHFANMVAAIFLATGQDLAHVVDGSMGITTTEVVANGDLYFAVYLPSLMVGTVGGGTGLPTQKEALEILGIERTKKGAAVKLAEAVGLAVLAGELSLTAALAGRDLGRAHQKLGRSK
jgi:hydroxymethylglutaryl-CoA reductase (NADPH)